MISGGDIAEVLKTEGRMLIFLPIKPDMKRHGGLYLGLAFLLTWLVGIGRYWDNPHASLRQHLGVDSVLYLFVLAFILWFLLLPLRPRNWSYRNVLTFVGLTAPPGFLYALPVERLWGFDTTTYVRIWLLAIVAVWRVALLLIYLKRSAGMSIWVALLATVLPLDLIVVALTILNLDHAVYDIMAGLEGGPTTVNDRVYEILFIITLWSMLGLIPILVAYLVAISRREEKPKDGETIPQDATDPPAVP